MIDTANEPRTTQDDERADGDFRHIGDILLGIWMKGDLWEPTDDQLLAAEEDYRLVEIPVGERSDS